jgi:hypothetical protein
MKATDFINRHWKNLLIAVLLVFLFIAFRQCKGEKDKNQVIAAAAKDLQAKVKADSLERAEERKAFARDKQDAEGRRELAVVEKQEADKKVQQQQKIIDKLVAVIRKEDVTDTDVGDMVQVSKQYKNACDSLPAQIDILNHALADKDSAINEWSDILAYEIQLRDEEIYKEMNYSDSLKADFNRQTALLKLALKTGKPRGRLLGGISVLGNENQFLSGAGVVLAYQTKGGKQYQVSPKFIKVPGGNAQAYYEGTVLFTIFK